MVASASLLLGLTLVAVLVVNFALARTVEDTVDGDTIVAALAALGWAVLVLSGIVVLGLAVGAWLHRPLWARGVALVMAGMGVYLGWWWLDHRVDLFGMSTLAPDDPALYARAEARLWTTLGIDVVAVLALLVGGVLLLFHREAPDEPADEADDREGADAGSGSGPA